MLEILLENEFGPNCWNWTAKC